MFNPPTPQKGEFLPPNPPYGGLYNDRIYLFPHLVGKGG